MKQDERTPFDRALRRARLAAYAPGEFVGQESFVTAGQVRTLAAHAGVGPGTSLLDLCCGVAGPGRLIARETACTYLGVDASRSAIEIARDRAGDLGCRFLVAEVPPVPAGRFDVVLLLETLLAFPDKEPLLRGIAQGVPSGGRFAFSLEEGPPLSDAERASMPGGDTVWLTPFDEVAALLEAVGFRIRWQEDWSLAHRSVADSLRASFQAESAAIVDGIGHRALDDLVASHRLWSDWLGTGRVRKLALVAEKVRAT